MEIKKKDKHKITLEFSKSQLRVLHKYLMRQRLSGREEATLRYLRGSLAGLIISKFTGEE